MKNNEMHSDIFNDIFKIANILYVEHDRPTRNKISKDLKKVFKKVFSTKSADEALNLFRNNKIDIVVTNSYVPQMGGIEFLENLKNLAPNLPCIVILTAYNTKDIMNLISLGINHIVANNFVMEDLLFEIYQAYKMTYYNQLQKKEREVKKLKSLVKNKKLGLNDISKHIIKQNNKFEFKDSKSRENILFGLKYLTIEDGII